MKPNIALALSLMGIAAALQYRENVIGALRMFSALAALIGLAIGIITLTEYVLATDLRIDQLLFHTAEAGPYPGRPSPPAAFALVLLSTGLLLVDLRPAARMRPSEWFLLGAFFTAFIALVGFAFGAGPLYRLTNAPVTGVAVPTAVSLVLISLGVLHARPHAGLMRIATSTGPGGIMLRRLALPAVIAPVVLGPIVIGLLEMLGVQDFPLVAATLAIVLTAVALLLLTVTALPLDRVYQALEKSRTRTRNLVEYAPDGIFVATTDKYFIDVNDAGCRMLGFSREEIIGKSILDFIPPEEAGRLEQEKERLLKGEVVVSEWLVRCKNGTYLPTEVSAKIIADGRWQGFLRDISERKRIEREERILSELASVLSSTLDYEATLDSVARLVTRELADICVVEAVEEGGTAGQFKVAHRDAGKAAMATMLHQFPSGRCLLSSSSVLDAKQPLVVSDIHADDLESLIIDGEHRRALRGLAPVSLLAVPLLVHGRLVGSMILISVTATHRFGPGDLQFAEKVAYRAAWAVENARLYRTAVLATQSRDDLLGVVAHDLRSPLSTIIMQATLLRQSAKEALGGRSGEVAEVINYAATRMSRLIEDLLDVSRIEAGGLSIEPMPVPVLQLILDCIRHQQVLASASLQELVQDVVLETPAVWGDRNRLMQILDNLINNAIKYSERGGRITVGAAQEGGEVRFRVSDTGIGIPAEQLPHVFDRFWQARNTGRCGAGLGLAIVRGLVEAQGGRIWVESVPGTGSTFFFTIPTAPDVELRQTEFLSTQ